LLLGVGLIVVNSIVQRKIIAFGSQKIITSVRKLPSQECDTERMLDSYRPGFPFDSRGTELVM
jgi:hypothetical protein